MRAVMEKKKGQVAMEYLVTYGWALIIVVAIMAILYSTIFKPEFYITEKCDMAPGLECHPHLMLLKAATDPGGAELRFTVTNLMGYDIKINTMEFIPKDLAVAGEESYMIDCGPGLNTTCSSCEGGEGCISSFPTLGRIDDGESKEIGILFKGEQPEIGKLYRIKFIMNYTITEPGTGTAHRTAGIINARGS